MASWAQCEGHNTRLSTSISSCHKIHTWFFLYYNFNREKKILLAFHILLKKQVKNWAENFKFRLSTDDINELSLTPNGVQPTEPLSYQNPLFLLWQKTFQSEMGFFTDCWEKFPIKWQKHLPIRKETFFSKIWCFEAFFFL